MIVCENRADQGRTAEDGLRRLEMDVEVSDIFCGAKQDQAVMDQATDLMSRSSTISSTLFGYCLGLQLLPFTSRREYPTGSSKVTFASNYVCQR